MKNKIIDKWEKASLLNSDTSTPFPIPRNFSPTTIASSIPPLRPLNGLSDKDINEIKSINRERKIDSFLENKEYVEMKLEDHPNYHGPKGILLYLDFQYGSTQSE